MQNTKDIYWVYTKKNRDINHHYGRWPLVIFIKDLKNIFTLIFFLNMKLIWLFKIVWLELSPRYKHCNSAVPWQPGTELFLWANQSWFSCCWFRNSEMLRKMKQCQARKVQTVLMIVCSQVSQFLLICWYCCLIAMDISGRFDTSHIVLYFAKRSC